MRKNNFIFLFFVFSLLLLTSCDNLNSPDQYMMIPGKIIISTVQYDSNNNNIHYIDFTWGDYQSPHTGFQITRDNNIIATLSKESNSFEDTVTSNGTYEYRVYASNGTNLSTPSYIRIQINSYNYNFWYQ
jgi:hypothetical protein